MAVPVTGGGLIPLKPDCECAANGKDKYADKPTNDENREWYMKPHTVSHVQLPLRLLSHQEAPVQRSVSLFPGCFSVATDGWQSVPCVALLILVPVQSRHLGPACRFPSV